MNKIGFFAQATDNRRLSGGYITERVRLLRRGRAFRWASPEASSGAGGHGQSVSKSPIRARRRSVSIRRAQSVRARRADGSDLRRETVSVFAAYGFGLHLSVYHLGGLCGPVGLFPSVADVPCFRRKRESRA